MTDRTTWRSSLLPSLIPLALSALAMVACDSDPDPAHNGDTTGSGAGSSSSTTGSGGTGGTGGSEPPVGVCDPPLVAVAPSGTDGVVYPDPPLQGCYGGPCLCADAARPFVDHVLACDPIAGGYWAPLGSLDLRVAGRESGACVIDVGIEVEGGVSHHRCRLPLPIEPWPGLAFDADPTKGSDGFLEGIADECELVGTCCILDGCPDPCDATLPDVPLCPWDIPSISCNW